MHQVRKPFARIVRNHLSARVARHVGSLLVYLRSIALLLIIWYAVSLLMNNPALLPSPLRMIQSFVQLIISGELITDARISLVRLALGWGIAALVGIPLGILMGLSRYAEDFIDPVIELLRPISGIAWIPIALFIFGIGQQLPIFIIFYGAFFPFVLNSVAGVRNTDRTLIRVARTMGMKRNVILQHVILPSSLPSILVGARLASGAAWMALVAAELLGAPSGLGFSIEQYRQLLQTSNVMATIAAIGILGYSIDQALRALQRSLTPWSISSEDSE